jgi:hypothetical protein
MQFGRFLPDLNNERGDGHRNDTYAQNFAALKKLVLVKALADTVRFWGLYASCGMSVHGVL